MILVLAIFGCTNSEEEPQGTFKVEMADYHGLEEGAGWTYRDDDIDEMDDFPDEEMLLRAQYTSDGIVELRRGRRWADSIPVGSMVWDFEDGLSLISWSLPFDSGEGDFPIASSSPEEEPSVSNGDWSCVNTGEEELETWYALFDKVILFECTGGELEGEFAFAKNIGLVHLRVADTWWNLVAPW